MPRMNLNRVPSALSTATFDPLRPIAIRRPSGDQSGAPKARSRRRSNLRSFVPSERMVKSLPSCMNAILRPSGDQAGSAAHSTQGLVRRRARPFGTASFAMREKRW